MATHSYVVEVHVGDPEASKFRPTHAGVDEKADHRGVTALVEPFACARVEETLQLRLAEHGHRRLGDPGWYPDPASSSSEFVGARGLELGPRARYRCWDSSPGWTRYVAFRAGLSPDDRHMARDLKSKSRLRGYPPPIEAERITVELGPVFGSRLSPHWEEAMGQHPTVASMNRGTTMDVATSRQLLQGIQPFDDAEVLIDATPGQIREVDKELERVADQQGHDSRSTRKPGDTIFLATTHGLYYVTPSLGAVTRWPWSECSARLVRRGRAVTDVEYKAILPASSDR